MGDLRFSAFSILATPLVVSFIYSGSTSADPGLKKFSSLSWPDSVKQAIGTAYEPHSKSGGASSPVWFTVSHGILTEVFYPSPEHAQTRALQFIVTDGGSFYSEQKTDVDSRVSFSAEGMSVHISGHDRQNHYSFEQDIVTDPSAPVVRIKTNFHWNQPGLRAFVVLEPAINASLDQDLVSATTTALFATSGITATPWSALVPSVPFLAVSSGYVGLSDAYTDLSNNYRITAPENEAGPGQVTLTGELPVGIDEEFSYELALAFGVDQNEAQQFAETSLELPFDLVRDSYDNGWQAYASELDANLNSNLNASNDGLRFFSESAFVKRSAEILKMHEDKTNLGAFASSLSFSRTAPGRVLPSDVYYAALGLLAAGDHTSPVSALHYLLRLLEDNESIHENGDELSFPILLASQLQARADYDLSTREIELIKKAGLLVQTRGVSNSLGYNSSSIAIRVAALRACSALTEDPSYAETANQWQSMVERWTLTPSGKWGNNYYTALSPSGTPETPEFLKVMSGDPAVSATALSSSVIDGSFMDLVRYRLRGVRDPRIVSTLQIYDSSALGLSRKDERTSAFEYRSPFTGKTRPVLSAERGEYAIAAGQTEQARAELFILEKRATENGLLPEELDSSMGPSDPQSARFGVACPSIRAHAEDILLHRGLEEGYVFDAPRTQPQ